MTDNFQPTEVYMMPPRRDVDDVWACSGERDRAGRFRVTAWLPARESGLVPVGVSDWHDDVDAATAEALRRAQEPPAPLHFEPIMFDEACLAELRRLLETGAQ